MLSESRLKKLNQYAQYRTERILEFSCNYLLRSPLALKGQRLLDIGGGHGIMSLYAALLGAESVLLEPELDGSAKGMISTFQRAKQDLGLTTQAIHLPMTFQDFVADPEWSKKRWDIVLLSNSINHLDEDATIHLQTSAEASARVTKNLAALYDIINPGGRLIVTDCMRRNFWGDLGLKSPFAPSIEWHKHQDPRLWSEFLGRVGFSEFKIQWSKFQMYRLLGLPVLSNRFIAYFTNSHFKIECIR